MLQKLRLKFIFLTMALLFLVLFIIMGTINLLNYRYVVDSADQIISFILEGNGRFPENFSPENKPFSSNISPELPFETRFFTVILSEDGTASFVDTGKIVAVSSETAISYAEKVWKAHQDKGFIDEYRYAVEHNATEVMIVFIDCGRQLNAATSFLLISAAISLTGYMIVSLLLYILSARIVKPISDSYEKQRQFITNASHDLKTPITIINADIDVLEMDTDENEWIHDIRKQTKRLSELIRELVFLSRLEEKENHFEMIDFPVSDVVEEEAQSFESLARTQEKSFSMQVQPMISYIGDENAFRRFVTIILDNALKYSNEKGHISITLKKDERTLKLEVHNTCEQITQEDIQHLFERFYRGDKSRNSQTGGSGIGLSIAKAVVEAHNGSIRAITKDNQSLTVVATFPIK